MPKQEISSLSKRLAILIGLGVVGAMAFGLTISFYRNLLFEETLIRLQKRNKDLRINIDSDIEMLAYYRSSQYRDKYAKENLNRMNPGEKILIISNKKSILDLDIVSDSLSRAEQTEAAYRQYLLKIPTIDHWRMYLFEQDKLQELRISF